MFCLEENDPLPLSVALNFWNNVTGSDFSQDRDGGNQIASFPGTCAVRNVVLLFDPFSTNLFIVISI